MDGPTRLHPKQAVRVGTHHAHPRLSHSRPQHVGTPRERIDGLAVIGNGDEPPHLLRDTLVHDPKQLDARNGGDHQVDALRNPADGRGVASGR